MSVLELSKNIKSISYLLSVIRDVNCKKLKYKYAVDRLCNILSEEALVHLSSVKQISINTPTNSITTGISIDYDDVCVLKYEKW